MQHGRNVGLVAGISTASRKNIRVLIDEACAVVDLVVNNNVKILLGGVLRDVRVGEFLGLRHCGYVGDVCWRGTKWASLRGWQRVSRARMRGGPKRRGVVEETRRTDLKIDYLPTVSGSEHSEPDSRCACTIAGGGCTHARTHTRCQQIAAPRLATRPRLPHRARVPCGRWGLAVAVLF